MLNQAVDGRPGLDHQHDFAGNLEAFDQVFQAVATDEVFAFGAPFDQMVNLFGRPVVDRNVVAAALNVERQVLTHHRQANKADIALCHD